jgi:hypothetical protein
MQDTTPFDGILEESRDLICERLDDAVADMLDKANEVLSALINDTQNREQLRLYQEAKDVALTQRGTIEKHFRSSFLGELQRRSNQARTIGQRFDESDYSLDELELVGNDDFEETLIFNAMADKLRAYCDEELVALDQRVGVLLGNADLQAKDSPFSPQVICNAYKHACRHLDADSTVRRVLLKLFDDHVLDDIRSIYKAVNALLVRNSILPKIRYSFSRKNERNATTDPETPPAAPAASMTLGVAQDLFAMLQTLVANNAVASGHQDTGGQPGTVEAQGSPAGALGGQAGVQAGAVGVRVGQGGVQAGPAGVLVGAGLPAGGADLQAASGGGTAFLQGTELLGSLTRIQIGDLSAITGGNFAAAGNAAGTINVLRELKGTNVGTGMSPMDSLTLDIVAMLFDQLFDDPKVPNGVKGLIGRLQIPMLKVAIADKSFFSKKTHPARRLLDAWGEIALRLPAEFSTSSPLFDRLQNIAQELVDGFQDDLECFAKAREQIHEILAEEDRRIEQETQAAAKPVEEMETLELAKTIAQEEIRTRVLVRKLPLAVVEFLAQQWLKLLLLIYVKEGKDGQAWTEALELMDQLIWSVEPKNTLEERRALAAMLPTLVKQLTAGLKTAGVEDEVRVKFFAELMKYHTQAIGAPAQDAPRIAPAIQSKRSASPDFSAPITVKNPFGEGEVSVDGQELDFTAIADSARTRREESIRRALDSLAMGTWVEFREADDQGKGRPARLIFVSPRKTRYLFAVDRAGKEIIQISRAEIGRRLRLGEAVKLDGPPEESLFDRIMNGLLGKLRTSGRAALFAQ